MSSKQRKLLQSFMPADSTDLFGHGAPNFSSDLENYVYSCRRITSGRVEVAKRCWSELLDCY